MRKVLQVLISVGISAAAAGCGDATGILVEVTSDLAVPAEIDGLRFSVSTTSGRTLERSYPIVSAFPHSLTLLPATNSEGEVTIVVRGLLADTPVVSQTVIATFVPGVTTTVRVALMGACVGVMCAPRQECVGGMCVDLPVDAGVDAGGGDAGRDDAGADAGADAGRDAGVDAGRMDGGFDAGTDAGTDAGPPASLNLFFSQYLEGSSNNKALEITNEGSAPANLGGCLIRRYSNGGTSPSNIALGGTIAVGDVFVICHSSIEPSATCDTMTSAISHNGDDAYDLICGGTVLDTFGRIGEDPGTEWTGGGLGTQDYVLTRRCTVTMGDPVGSDPFDPSVQWTGGPWVSPAASLGGLGNRAECP